MKKVITNEIEERIEVKWDGVRFGVVKTMKPEPEMPQSFSIIILNPREAQEIANFINENNREYLEKKLSENIERVL